MNTPYGIFEYNIDKFSAYVTYQTNTNFAYLLNKPQIVYLNNYISNFLPEKDKEEYSIVFVYENEYIDKHYIEDYTVYYARCFTNYRKTTSRVHFFKIKKNSNYKQILSDALNGDQDILNDKSYLGCIVLRPIPKTFLAKVCLRPYERDKNRLTKYWLSADYDISLFGIPLKIKTIAFQEQDKVLSACATTALWTFFHAHDSLSNMMLPSSSTITKNSYPVQNGYSREFPNMGLSTEMICRGLRSCHLVPEYFEIYKNKTVDIKQMKELIYAYSSSDIPLILGVNVFNKNGIEQGLHAITIVGYSISEVKKYTELYSDNVESLYVHDDRYGPYLKLIFKEDKFEVIIEDKKKQNYNSISSEEKQDILTKLMNKIATINPFTCQNENKLKTTHFSEETYVPDTLILGLYHKIRIPFNSIKTTCTLLNKNMIDMMKRIKDEDVSYEIKLLESITWDISLTKNSSLKSKIINSSSPIWFKTQALTQSWPKYIWSAKILIDNKCEFELLFDATDIEQSKVFIGFVLYNEEVSLEYYELLEAHCTKTRSYYSTEENYNYFSLAQDNFIYGIKEYFKQSETYDINLNKLYGYLKIPEYLKDLEVEAELLNDEIIRVNSVEDINTKGFVLNKDMQGKDQYIWLIDKDGFLCITEEREGSTKGHPTITGGMPARIGGELKFIAKENIWCINNKSGRFSLFEYTLPEQKEYINNVMKYKFVPFFPEEKFKCEVFLKK